MSSPSESQPSPEELARLAALLAPLASSTDALAALVQALAGLRRATPPAANGDAAAVPPVQLVTLDQCAVLVHVKKRTLYRYRARGLPRPRRKGWHGRPALYEWAEVRPFLEEHFNLRLPVIHPYHVAGNT
jgi:hypothetical protein